jgi:hypothetical protein
MSPVHYATGFADVGVLRVLHSLGANMDAQDNNGDAAVLIAAYESRIDILSLLYELGCNINIQNNRLLSAAHIAVHHENMEIVKALYYMGADMGGANIEGKTPIDLAKTMGNSNMISFLTAPPSRGSGERYKVTDLSHAMYNTLQSNVPGISVAIIFVLTILYASRVMLRANIADKSGRK